MDEDRNRLCRNLGLADISAAHALIMHRDVKRLIRYRLVAPTLERLGYNRTGMERLGYTDPQLEQIGFAPPAARPAAARPAPETAGEGSDIFMHMVRQGLRAPELKARGFTAHHCKKSGMDVREAFRIGFELADLKALYSVNELKRAGFGVRDMRPHFSAGDLRTAGYSADEMRLGGVGIRELLNAGYPENQVRTAGYSTNELIHEGLTRHTVDKTRMQNSGQPVMIGLKARRGPSYGESNRRKNP